MLNYDNVLINKNMQNLALLLTRIDSGILLTTFAPAKPEQNVNFNWFSLSLFDVFSQNFKRNKTKKYHMFNV